MGLLGRFLDTFARRPRDTASGAGSAVAIRRKRRGIFDRCREPIRPLQYDDLKSLPEPEWRKFSLKGVYRKVRFTCIRYIKEYNNPRVHDAGRRRTVRRAEDTLGHAKGEALFMDVRSDAAKRKVAALRQQLLQIRAAKAQPPQQQQDELQQQQQQQLAAESSPQPVLSTGVSAPHAAGTAEAQPCVVAAAAVVLGVHQVPAPKQQQQQQPRLQEQQQQLPHTTCPEEPSTNKAQLSAVATGGLASPGITIKERQISSPLPQLSDEVVCVVQVPAGSRGSMSAVSACQGKPLSLMGWVGVAKGSMMRLLPTSPPPLQPSCGVAARLQWMRRSWVCAPASSWAATGWVALGITAAAAAAAAAAAVVCLG